METYYCVCRIQIEDDNIVVKADTEGKALVKAKQQFLESLSKELNDLGKLVECECYTEEELEDMDIYEDAY